MDILLRRMRFHLFKMESWPTLLIILIIAHKSSNEKAPCVSKRTQIGTQQIICTNTTSAYLESNPIVPNRTNWFTCDFCNLTTITSKTFNFPTNQIVYLNLTNARINSIKNLSFQKTPHLKLLLLKSNAITELEDRSLYSLKRLQQLDLSLNYLAALQDDLFLDLKELDILNLNHNSINRFHPRAFNGLHNLKYLYLSANDITYMQPYLFKYLTSLRILYLEHNKLREVSPLAFTNLNSLSFLYLNNNTIEVLSDYNFKQLPNLEDLQLRDNDLTEIANSAFNGLRNLKFLYLGNNNISIIEEHAFMGLDSLLVLDMINNLLETFPVEHLANMPNLTTAWFENNHINTFPASTELPVQDRLFSLDLNANNLSYFNYKILLKKLPGLEEVFVGENDWKCEFFVPMQDYFEELNVSLCITHACNQNDTILYAEKLCKLGFNGTDGDRSSSCGPAFNMTLVWALLALSFVYL